MLEIGGRGWSVRSRVILLPECATREQNPFKYFDLQDYLGKFTVSVLQVLLLLEHCV
jgi:hypothetical protein